MRSELVYSAGAMIGNRFLLASVTMRAVKRLHVGSTRTEDTANQVFSEIATGRYIEVTMPEVKPAPLVEALLVSSAA